MLNPGLQAKLTAVCYQTRSGWRFRVIYASIGIAVLSLVVIGLGFRDWQPETSETTVPEMMMLDENLGKLVLLAADARNLDPVSVWRDMERHLQKPGMAFTEIDRQKAIQFLLDNFKGSDPELRVRMD